MPAHPSPRKTATASDGASAALDEVSYFGNSIPFLALVGVEPVSRTPGQVEARLPFRPELANKTGYAHGGMVMTVLDFAMASAAGSHDPGNIMVSTIDMTTSFILGTNTDLTVRATCLRQGKSVAFCEAEARNAAGELVAKASGSFAVRRRPPAG